MREPLDPQVAVLQVLLAGLIGAAAGVGRTRLYADLNARPLATIWSVMMASMLGASLVLLTDNIGRAAAAGFAIVAVATGAVARRADPPPSEAVGASLTLLAYWAGAHVGRGEWAIAGAITALLAILVASPQRIEARLRSLSPTDTGDAITFAVVATVAHYLLPDVNLGPWGVLNPRRLWSMTVFVSTLSFAAFLAMRLWERSRGAYVGGAIGGLISSTALTVAFAKQSRASNNELPLALGAALSSLTMLVRVAVLAQAAGGTVAQRLLPFLCVTVAGGAAAVLLVARAARPAACDPDPIGSPFRWQAAVRFAALYTLVKLGVEVALRNFGATGVLWSGALAGLVDVDAVTLTLAGIAGRIVDPRVAATAIAVSILVNLAAKAGYAVIFGGGAFGRAAAAVLGSALAAGAAALALRL